MLPRLPATSPSKVSGMQIIANTIMKMPGPLTMAWALPATTGAWGMPPGAPTAAVANSGIAPAGCQSPPSTLTWVLAFRRLPA